MLKVLFKRVNVFVTNTTNHLQPIYDFESKTFVEANNYQYYFLKKGLSDPEVYYVSEYMMPSIENDKKTKIKWKHIFSTGWHKSVNLELFFIPVILSKSFYKKKKIYKRKYISELNKISLDSFSLLDSVFLSSVISKKNLVYLSLFRDCVSNCFLSFFKPKVIASVAEYNLNNYSLLKQNSLKEGVSIAIQHGAIFKENISYYYSENEDKKNIFFPDKTLVWGEKWKQNLVELCNYPVKKLKVLGQIRSEAIGYFLKTNSKEEYYLYISQPLRDGEQNKRDFLLDSFIKVCEQNPKSNFIIKPHPRELDYSVFYNRIIEKKLKNVKVVSDDLFFLIAKSKAVIIYFSTVGIEALAFNKQLIVLDFYNEDSLGLIKDGVGIGVKNVQELNKAVKEIDSGVKSISLESIKNYVNGYFYKIEYGISQRYINYIKSFNNEK